MNDSEPISPNPAPSSEKNHAIEPTGPPQPCPALDTVGWGISTALAVATGVFIAPAFLSVGHTAGATRSARLEWERRAREIAAAEADACQKPQTTDSSGPDAGHQ